MPGGKFILVIGSSAGGTLAVPELLRQLQPDMNIAVFVVIHMAKRSIGDLFVKRAQKFTELKCKVPRNGEDIKRGHIYFAKPDHHLMLEDDQIIVGKGPMENRYRPSIDVLFRSAAAAFDHKVIGIILSGMLEDGAAGMSAIKRAGGKCIVQDPNEAQYADMPQAALRSIKPDYVVPVSAMGESISKLMKKPGKKRKIPDDLKKEAGISRRVSVGMEPLGNIGEHSVFSCPDCGGGLWSIRSNGDNHYRCHVGHSFSEESLLSAMEVTTESALWTALRIIEEKRNLLKKLAGKEKQAGSGIAAGRYSKRIKELTKQMEHLRQVLFAIRPD